MTLRAAARVRLMIALALGLALAGVAGAEPGKAPRLEATLLDGKAYSLVDSRGSPVVLMLWSPASLSSRKTLPEMQRFFVEYSRRGVTIMALSTSGDVAEVRRVADSRGLQAPLGVLGEHEFGPLPEARLPAIRVIDRNGRVVAAHDGLFRLRDLQREVDALLTQ